MPPSLRLQIPAFIAIRVVLNTMLRMVYPFLSVFALGLGVDVHMISLAVSLRAIPGVLGPFLAFISDSRGRRSGMLLGLGLFVAGTALMAAWPSYPAFVLTLGLTLLGNFVFIPAMQAHLGDRVPYQRRGLALALTELGWSLSFIVGVPLVGLLVARAGWQAVFPVLCGLGALAMAGLAWLLPKDRPPAGDRSGPGHAWRGLKAVFSYAPALAGLAIGVSLSGANEMVNITFAVWMEDAFQVKLAALAAASAVIGLSELGGEALVSGIADRLGKPRAVGLGAVANCLAALTLPWIGHSLAGALVGLFIFYLTFEFTIVSSIPLMTEVLPAARATLMACFIASTSVGRALGAFAAPQIYSLAGAATPNQGLLAVTLGSVAFNAIALIALAALRKQAVGV
jgi:predicted MFS family arabinose efflux permease